MADLNTSQKAPLVVTQADGTPLGSWSVSVADESVAVVTDNGFAIAGVGAGSTVVTVTSGGQTGTLAVSVDVAPLVVSLGAPVPK